VTVAEYAAFVRATGRKRWYDLAEAAKLSDEKLRWPAFMVDWRDATAYAAWLAKRTGRGYRLPTEAEWEYAARAGTTTARHWGEDPSGACRHANVADRTAEEENPDWLVHECDDGHYRLAPVGSFRANPWGVHDMLGNVWGWTCSEYDEACAGGETRCAPADAGGRRVGRGGSWSGEPAGVRSADRGRLGRGGWGDSLGLRLTRTP
jgi:formylglycine-generating enzyme required for sulfatase activity